MALADVDEKHLLQSLLPWIAAILAAGGVYVESLPLKSQRPSDEERAKFAHVGRQDVEARLWQDPFSALSPVSGQTPEDRCKAAIADKPHHLETLSRSVTRRKDSYEVTTLGVMLPGGPYFEDGEQRRRSRYAVVSALLNSGWTPLDGDKLGFVWTFESCLDSPWARRAPELLPYEWFMKESAPGSDTKSRNKQALLVLWLEEDAMSRSPLKAMERVIGLVGNPRATICPSASNAQCGLGHLTDSEAADAQCTLLTSTEALSKDDRAPAACSVPRTIVIGPGTTDTLNGMIRELAAVALGEWQPATTPDKLRFYASGATGEIKLGNLERNIEDARSRCTRLATRETQGRQRPCAAPTEPADAAALEKTLAERVVRLTTTDDKLASKFLEELELRLTDPTPFWRIGSDPTTRLCETTIVIVAEQNSDYSRQFRDLFSANREGQCTPRIHNAGYLRGIDGILPSGKAEPEKQETGTAGSLPDIANALISSRESDRAEGRTQYDYISRLAQELVALDASERREGRDGVRAIGVLGSDVYDKLVVLDSLRPHFPRAVFFAADLDARLVGGKAAASTRNLVVASAYGLTLQPELQRRAPPFRDTYQTGTYFATLVATSSAPAPDQQLFARPLAFEIGRTQAVPLDARQPENSIHPPGTAKGQAPWPSTFAIAVTAIVMLPLAALLWLISPSARLAVSRDQRGFNARALLSWSAVIFLALALIAAGWSQLWQDATSGSGEPFAWFEGVSIWPTEILRLVALVGIVLMLYFGRRQLRKNIDAVAGDFQLPTLSERRSVPGSGKKRSFVDRIRWLWWFDSDPNRGDELWERYLDSMRMGPSSTRTILASMLFFVATVAVLSIDWPHSPHRGAFAAWVNHLMLLVMTASVIGLLFAVLDSSLMAARLLDHIVPATQTNWTAFWAPTESYWNAYPAGKRYVRPLVTFHFAVRLASAVNKFVYLPFAAFLLLLPARSRFFDNWDFPWPYLAVLMAAVLLATLAAARLRHAAAMLRNRVLVELDKQAESDRNAARLGPSRAESPLPVPSSADVPDEDAHERVSISGMHDSANPAYLFWEEQSGRIERVPLHLRAGFVRGITEEIRATREGPFQSFWDEPVVRALLIIVGGSGSISLVEFFFFKGL